LNNWRASNPNAGPSRNSRRSPPGYQGARFIGRTLARADCDFPFSPLTIEGHRKSRMTGERPIAPLGSRFTQSIRKVRDQWPAVSVVCRTANNLRAQERRKYATSSRFLACVSDDLFLARPSRTTTPKRGGGLGRNRILASALAADRLTLARTTFPLAARSAGHSLDRALDGSKPSPGAILGACPKMSGECP